MTEKIIFNGKVYHSEAEMPPNVREAYNRINKFFVDANQDGIPDFIQQGGLAGIKDVFTFAKDISKSAQGGATINPDQFTVIRKTENRINVNGREFNSTEEMPPEIRRAYERIVDKVDPAEFDIYDEPWRDVDRDDYFVPHDDEVLLSQTHDNLSNPVIEDVSTNTNLIIFIVVASVLCVAAAVWLVVSGSIPGI